MARTQRQTPTTLLIADLKRFATAYNNNAAADLAMRLEVCACRSGSGKYCNITWMCPGCNTRMQRRRWKDRYHKFTMEMLEARATPLVVRIRPRSGLTLRDSFENVRRHLLNFVQPMRSCNRRRSHPLAHVVLAGTSGKSVKQTVTGYDIQSAIMLWVRPDSGGGTTNVLARLCQHAKSQGIPPSQLSIDVIASNEQKTIINAVRDALELTSCAWTFTAPADAVWAYGLLSGIRRSDWFGVPSTKLKQLTPPRVPNPLNRPGFGVEFLV